MDPTTLQVDPQRIRSCVEELAAGPRHSLHAPGQHARAVEHIANSFHDAGLEVGHQAFDGAGRRGINLIGHKAGSHPSLPPLLVTAHYDTVADSPGADDNASAVAALLEIGHMLARVAVQRSVELVAFDMEEVQPDGSSLVGSNAYVSATARVKPCLGVYNLEMIGYTSGPDGQHYPPGFGMMFPQVFRQVQARDFRGDFLAVVARRQDKALGSRLKEAATQWAPQLDVVLIEMPGYLPVLPDFRRSDHASFWAAGIPAVMVTDTANFRNPHYHQQGDTAATLDFDFLCRVTQAMVGAIAAMCEASVETC